jgi:hypothetical protein
MKISYALTVCNELEEISKLLNFLHRYKRVEDEICVLLDKPKASQQLLDELYYWSSKDIIILKESAFQGHFANWKNELTRMCSGDYIFQIDADEMPSLPIIQSLHDILEYNPDVDVYLVPRVNTVEGMTQDHIREWGWNVNEDGWVNFPDYQWRIYKNNGIKWINKVHERLDGFNRYSLLPSTEEYSLYHPKTIERQVKQNDYYNTL